MFLRFFLKSERGDESIYKKTYIYEFHVAARVAASDGYSSFETARRCERRLLVIRNRASLRATHPIDNALRARRCERRSKTQARKTADRKGKRQGHSGRSVHVKLLVPVQHENLMPLRHGIYRVCIWTETSEKVIKKYIEIRGLERLC